MTQAVKLLVGLDQAVAADAHDDCPQPVEHVVDAVGLGRDTGVQADESITEVFFDEGFLGLAREVLVGKVVPAETRELTGAASKAGADAGLVRDAAAK